MSTVEVKCQSGFSGGLNQRFIMEVFETVNNTQVLVATNWTDLDVGNNQPVSLGVWGLLPDSDYIISVKSTNEKGESSPVYVGGSTRILPSGDATWLPINDHNSDNDSRMPLLFVIVGILVTLMIMGALVTAILAVRRRRLMKLTQIEITSSNGSNGSSPPILNTELQEALIKPEEKVPNIQRKVSFREEPSKSRNYHHRQHCPECEIQVERSLTPPIYNYSASSSILPPVQKAVVRTFSIDKLRPVCPVCNPVGDTPYPDEHNIPKHPKNNNRIESPEEEVQRLNSELDELQQCLLNGAAALAAVENLRELDLT